MRLKWFRHFFGEGKREIADKKVHEVYISPHCWQNFMKLGVRGQVTDIITCVKLLVNRFRGYGVLTPQNSNFPLTCCVALTTVYALPCDIVTRDATRQMVHGERDKSG